LARALGRALRRSTTYEPPSEDLLEALGELVKYVTCADDGSGAPQPAQGAASWLPLAPVFTFLPQQQVRGGTGQLWDEGGRVYGCRTCAGNWF
jgi:hypothetical protein